MGIGLIRLLLAESVVMSHGWTFFGYRLFNSTMAVEMFFIVSGFYMAMILKNKYNDYWLFIKNRLLRLYPIYIAIIILTVAISILTFFAAGNWFKLYPYLNTPHALSPASYLFLIFANLTMLFQDVIMFTGLDKVGNLIFVANLGYSSIPPQNLLLIPPAWTLGLEWTFYVLAPFIVKRTRTLIALIAASLIIKILLMKAGLIGDLWDHRFFPAELYLFCCGVLAYDLYNKYKNRINFKMARIITLAFIGFIFIYFFLPLPAMIFYAAFILCLPFIFFYSRNMKFDRKVGELSYPVYLSHWLVISCFAKINFFSKINSNVEFILISFVVLSLSIFLLKYLQNPIDEIREFNLVKNAFYANLYLSYLQISEERPGFPIQPYDTY
jgi:peptidoglycan/LPS O-acetylase OafA/YrhL